MVNKELKVVPMQEIVAARRIGKVTTLTGITREGAKVYKMMARGEIPPEVGTKLMYALNVQAGIVKDSRILDEFADRIAFIESIKY